MKVLFITFYFPLMPNVAALRTGELCRGLLVAGHDVTVVTSDSKSSAANQAEAFFSSVGQSQKGELRIVRVGSWWKALHEGPSIRKAAGWRGKSWAAVNRLVSRLLTFIGFDPFVPWAAAACWAMRCDASYDCVLVSAGPFSTLFTGYVLARGAGIPLVYDYRDVWNGTPYIRWRCSTRWIESFLLARAALVVAVSPSCLASIVGRLKVPATVVTNGIGEDVKLLAFEKASDRLSAKPTRIVYAGAFWPPKSSFTPIAAALSLLKQSVSEPLHCTYLGPSGAHVREVAERHGVQELVEIMGYVPRGVALAAQAASLCAVVVTSIEPLCGLVDKGVVTGKLFEAIALAPNVLVISPADADVRAITAHLPHVKHFHGGEVTAIADWLATIDAAAPATGPKELAWQEFGWPHLARRFVARIEQAVGVSPTVSCEQVHD